MNKEVLNFRKLGIFVEVSENDGFVAKNVIGAHNTLLLLFNSDIISVKRILI